jgi:hypothetical protein
MSATTSQLSEWRRVDGFREIECRGPPPSLTFYVKQRQMTRINSTGMSETKRTFTGGCYCGDVRYQCEGPPLMRGQCYCLTCQKISGGAGNLFMAVDTQGFQFTKGTPTAFIRKIARGLPHGISARLAESTSLHAQNVRQVLCSSRSAPSTIPACLRDRNW